MMKKILFVLILCSVTTGTAFRQKAMLGEQIDWSHPLSLGLVGFWPINEGTGVTIRDIAGGATGVFGTGLWDTSDLGYVIDLDGSGTAVTLPAYSAYGGGPGMTVVLWYKAKVANIAASEYLLEQSDGAPDGIRMYRSSAEDLLFDCSGTDTSFFSYLVTFTDGVADTEWHMIVGQADAVNNRLWVDGVWAAPTARSGNVNIAPGDLLIGSAVAGASPSNGYLGSLMFYNRALSDAEINELYQHQCCMIVKEDPSIYVTSGGAPPSTHPQVIFISAIPLMIVGLAVSLKHSTHGKSG